MHKTCFTKSDGNTPIRDLFPVSTMEKPTQQQVEKLCCILVLEPLFKLLPTTPAAHQFPPKKEPACGFSAGVTDLQQILKVII